MGTFFIIVKSSRTIVSSSTGDHYLLQGPVRGGAGVLPAAALHPDTDPLPASAQGPASVHGLGAGGHWQPAPGRRILLAELVDMLNIHFLSILHIKEILHFIFSFRFSPINVYLYSFSMHITVPCTTGIHIWKKCTGLK